MATAELAAAHSDAKVREFNPWIVALAVIIPTFMEVLDTTNRQCGASLHGGRPFCTVER